jgi:hypothetical protein
MGSRVTRAPALHGIRTAVHRAAEEDGGVEYAHPLITKRIAEFFEADQPGQQWHLGNLLGINLAETILPLGSGRVLSRLVTLPRRQ